ncbi:hypothetical protein NQ315_006196 [Exocentrus adspersus]|uniref:Craniofacial development protein 1 n=1 Tax=Exocentrus adspersus TaxID=1586481 RepID=A0AAV8VZJ7_9CUCU|nr:hypothetical protein NQ315_006196 [Exocentrus adspersus]
MNVQDFADDSDTSDEDYVPSEKPDDLPSEVDSDGEPEEPVLESEEAGRKGKKRKKQASKVKKKLKDNSQEATNSNREEDSEKSKGAGEDKKKNVDDIWADFMKDTGFRPKNSNANSSVNSSKPRANSDKVNHSVEKPSDKQESKRPVEKVKVMQIFEFAGEEVKVEKEVPADSAEARLLKTDAPKTSKGRKSGLSGIGNVLSQLGKKPKISTLEKSKLDWDKFKKEENIEEELQTYNKGKDGFLDRQDFLQRADLRRFEIEKDIRAVERNKRFNSTL